MLSVRGERAKTVVSLLPPERVYAPFVATAWPMGEALHHLTCPVCGCGDTHHGGVAVFERKGEDGPITTMTAGPEGVQAALDDCPSPRRGAVRIAMRCERGHQWYFDVVQHKGTTYLECRIREGNESHG